MFLWNVKTLWMKRFSEKVKRKVHFPTETQNSKQTHIVRSQCTMEGKLKPILLLRVELWWPVPRCLHIGKGNYFHPRSYVHLICQVRRESRRLQTCRDSRSLYLLNPLFQIWFHFHSRYFPFNPFIDVVSSF